MKTRLKELIEIRGLSRKQVAKDLCIERRTLDNYINEVTQMNAEFIIRMANYLDVSTDYLLNAKIVSSSFLIEKIDKLSFELKEFIYYLSNLK